MLIKPMLIKILTFFQYALSICMIISGLVITIKDYLNLKKHPGWSASIAAVVVKFSIFLVFAAIIWIIFYFMIRTSKR